MRVPTLAGAPVEGAVSVLPSNQVVVVEGAYLWHNLGDWVELRRTMAGLLYVDQGEGFIGAQVMREWATRS